MTSIGKQSKISARKLIKENFILCFVTALLFTLPTQIYSFLPLLYNEGISFVIQLVCAPLVLVGCKVYVDISNGDSTIKPTTVFSGYGNSKVTNTAIVAAWKTLIITVIASIVPLILIFSGLLSVVIITGITNNGIAFCIWLVATVISFIICFVFASAECSCIYLGTLASYLNGEDTQNVKKYIQIFKREMKKVFIFSIGPSLFYLTLAIVDIFLFVGSHIITHTIGFMYLVACFTFYAKYTLDENIQNGTIQADISNISENIYEESQKYLGVDQDLL
ncbi:MAG: hypothetical protein R3Y09_10810 [Clostridia bacterium]